MSSVIFESNTGEVVIIKADNLNSDTVIQEQNKELNTEDLKSNIFDVKKEN